MVEAKYENGEIISAIKIDFAPESEDPSRIFRSMAALLDAMQALDKDLARSISVQIEPVQILHDVQAGSIKAWTRTIIRQLDDEALKNIDWKPLVGQYLVKAKHRILQWLSEHETVRDLKEIECVEQDLLELAQETDVLQLPSYAPVPSQRLLENLHRLGEGTATLSESDKVSYISPVGEEPIRVGFRLESEEIEELLTSEILESKDVLVLLVKKPDYLGRSKWEFRYENQRIEANVLDEAWLERFHQREILIGPGDALKARVDIQVRKGRNAEIIGVNYVVTEVIEVLRGGDSEQLSLLPEEKGLLDAERAERRDNILSENAVAVADHITWRRVEREGPNQLQARHSAVGFAVRLS